MLYSLRKAACEDLPAIYTFELAYIREIEPEVELRWINSIPLHLNQCIENLPRMTIAVDDKQAIGHAFWNRSDNLAETAEVGSVYVSIIARRQGIGRALLERCEQEAAAAGLKTMRLSVKRHNPAQALYKHMGYAYSRESEGYDVYEKALPSEKLRLEL